MPIETDFYNLLLNLMLFSPLIGVPLILLLNEKSAKVIALVTSIIPLALSAWVYSGYLTFGVRELETAPFAFLKAFQWFGSQLNGQPLTRFDINFITGVDGISIYLILLTTLLFTLSIWFSWGSIKKHYKAYYALLLILEMGVLGVFLSLDLILFYVFFEIGLIPMCFLIGIGGVKARIYASVKFFLYTLVGSFLMLVAIL